MIPIKEAINTGAWLHCEYSDNEKLFQFRIKILSFRKVKLTEIDRPENISNFDLAATIWIIEIEVINLIKEALSPSYSTDKIILIDQDGFKFHVFHDRYLRCWSDFAEKSKLIRFYGSDLIPKIKAVGAIPFLLPIDDEAEYSIAIKDGSIREA